MRYHHSGKVIDLDERDLFTVSAITSFSGRYTFLSNFSRVGHIRVDGITYPTVEHAFQAHKTLSQAKRREIAGYSTPSRAKRVGRKLELREDWDEIRIPLMLSLLRMKFALNTNAASRLLGTGDLALIEGNCWNDRFWGAVKKDGKWVGKNWLGRLLMQVREELREDNNGF